MYIYIYIYICNAYCSGRLAVELPDLDSLRMLRRCGLPPLLQQPTIVILTALRT